ncbi:MAG: restriction endonuclease subunit S, partial [Coprothermobacterota bacterium]|nr:restriction endonuclease subunit S [Coprothermobacterota bacterium]
ITTACLTESGFNPAGIKPARMWSRDVQNCMITAGEVLVARSNTSELVGRACIFDGIPEQVVASDLTIRIQTHGDLQPYFLAKYLSALFLSGYWREQAGGASGSMKKITRTQILALAIPFPPLSEQRRIAGVLREQMAAAEKTRAAVEEELNMINTLPAALLSRAFAGES